MPQLPTTGQANWGVPLNTFLEVSHDNTVTNGGKIKPEAILTTGANKVLTTDVNGTPTWVDKSSIGGGSTSGNLYRLSYNTGWSNKYFDSFAHPFGRKWAQISNSYLLDDLGQLFYQASQMSNYLIPVFQQTSFKTWKTVFSGIGHIVSGSDNFIDEFDDLYDSDLIKIDTGSIKWKNISAGIYYVDTNANPVGTHYLAISTDNKLYTWGDNTVGQLGNGGTATVNNPTMVESTKTWKYISAGNGCSYAIDSNDDLYAWGLNTNYNLGDGTTASSYIPKKISSQKWKQVEAFNPDIDDNTITSYRGVVALGADNNLYAWGYLGNFQTGLNVPTKVSNNTDGWAKVFVSSGGQDFCAISLTGKFYIWVDNSLPGNTYKYFEKKIGDGTWNPNARVWFNSRNNPTGTFLISS